MFETNRSPTDDPDQELIEVLTAIGVTSLRLAGKLSVLSRQSQSEKGENHGQGKRDVNGHQRPAPVR